MDREPWEVSDAVSLVRTRLSALADGDRAAQMAAYMKTDTPFYGVPKPDRMPLFRELVKHFGPSSPGSYRSLVAAMWAEPEREARYLAITVARRWSAYHKIDQLPMFERMVVEGSWWDYVDDIAANLVGPVLRSDPAAVWPTIDSWIDSETMWLRRTAILCQLKSKADTDSVRLFEYCAGRSHEREFFIRKAIGWALREYAKTDAEAVLRFVRMHRDALSGLSVREATKHLEWP